MPRYRCCNCEFVVGPHEPAECPVCKTTEFADIELLDDPKHPKNVERDAKILLPKGTMLLTVALAMGAGFYTSHKLPGLIIAAAPLVGGFVNLIIGWRKLVRLSSAR